MNPVIEVKNISKKYSIRHYQGRYVALRDVIGAIIKTPLRFLAQKTANVLGRGETKEDFWALKNINFSIKAGEAVGIIGANGAGKSTLLKILSGITPPTEGEIKITGTVASLLEVGTGFHPELSGRENIFLNGAILGMKKKEIERKFDQIVEFSGINQFLDTPVKRYSSGMYVRLAFAVAAHLEPDILLIDEVLAVGDAEFQKKCLGKMDEVTKQAGRTIIFVSHNMDAISRLCTKAILIEKGEIITYGNTEDVIGTYTRRDYRSEANIALPLTDENITLEKFSVLQDDAPTLNILGEKPFEISLGFTVIKQMRPFRIGIFLKNRMGTIISRSFAQDFAPKFEDIAPGTYLATITIPARLLLAGIYTLELKVFCMGIKNYFDTHSLEKELTIFSPKDYNELRSKNTDRTGYFLIPNAWSIKKND